MEIIYVPLDDTEEEYIKMRARMPWLALPYNRETVNEFVEHYLVQKFNVTTPPYGYGALTDVPGLVVIDRSGAMLKNLGVDEIGFQRGWKALGKWDLSLKF
ncbi:MAG: hypothetical protein KVP17_000759 [Porospora cf. gigantea B]|nr:MAG: hypothetical protein KVP17_000759 [Porospora cf. gigantea B]